MIAAACRGSGRPKPVLENTIIKRNSRMRRAERGSESHIELCSVPVKSPNHTMHKRSNMSGILSATSSTR